MEEIRSQVNRARRRLIIQQFLGILPWCVFSSLLVAMVALAIPKIWAIDVPWATWMSSWIGGSAALGVLLAVVWTYFKRRNSLDAAIEIDRRFGLKERISSSLSLAPEELETEAGRALVDDAIHRVKRLDVSERFAMQVGWQFCLPLVAMIAMLLLVVIPNATQDQADASTSQSQLQQELRKQRDAIRERIRERKKREAAKDLDDADLEMFKKIESGLDELTKTNQLKKKEALIKLNDLAKDLAKQREKLGGADDLRKHMQRLKNIEKGPADKVADAIKDGDFPKAVNEIQKLQDKMKKGDLSKEDMEKLANQLQQLQKKMQNMVDAHEKAKRDLERQIEQARAKNDTKAIDQLQKKMNQLQAQDKQMQKMQQMANQMQQCAQCAQAGDMQQAGEKLNQLAENLKQMQQDLDQLEMLNEALDQIAEAKNACAQCQGDGLANEMGMGQNGQQGRNGNGLGPGDAGRGLRPEEENKTKHYESRVRGKIQKGQAVFGGDATGPNKAGQTVEEIKAAIATSVSEDPDPISEQRLPRKQQNHARQYFEQFNK